MCCESSAVRKPRRISRSGWWTVVGICGVGLVGLCLTGCGKSGPASPTTTLEGMVRLDGQPVPEGVISFLPQGKKQAPATKADIREGRYSAQQVPIGPVLVMIRAPKKTGKIESIPQSKSQYEEVVETIPQKYLSGIPLDVTEDMKTKDFDLSSK